MAACSLLYVTSGQRLSQFLGHKELSLLKICSWVSLGGNARVVIAEVRRWVN